MAFTDSSSISIAQCPPYFPFWWNNTWLEEATSKKIVAAVDVYEASPGIIPGGSRFALPPTLWLPHYGSALGSLAPAIIASYSFSA
jgi:hypothetical protein